MGGSTRRGGGGGENGRKKAEGREQGKQRARVSRESGPRARKRSAARLGKIPVLPPSPPAQDGQRLSARMQHSRGLPNPHRAPADACRGSPFSSKETPFPQPTPLRPALAPQSGPINSEQKRYPCLRPVCPRVQTPSNLELPPQSPGGVSDHAIRDISLDSSQSAHRKYTHAGPEKPPRTHRRGTGTHSRSHATHRQGSRAPGPRARPGVSPPSPPITARYTPPPPKTRRPCGA